MPFISCFNLKIQFLCLFSLPFSLLNFDFTIHFFILVFYSVFRKHKLRSSVIDQIDKNVFTAEFFTVANTLTGSENFLANEMVELIM